MTKKSTSGKSKKVKSKAQSAEKTTRETAADRHERFVSDLEKVLKKNGIEGAFSSLTLVPFAPKCDPPCPKGTHCVVRVDRQTHEKYYVCVPD